MLDKNGNWVGDENTIDDVVKAGKEAAKEAEKGLDENGNWVGLPEEKPEKEKPVTKVKEVKEVVKEEANSDKKEKSPKK